MTNQGRNERCHCGSGRKYKVCCLLKSNSSVSTDLPWKQIRAARKSLNAEMMDYSIGIYDKGALQRAWEEWCCEVKEPLVMNGSEFVAFMSWFLVNWSSRDKKKRIPLPPLSWRFRVERGSSLSPTEKKYLDSVITEPFTFFEILQPKPGEGHLLKDILTGRELFVHEKSGSQRVEAGGILFGRLAQVDGISIFDSISEILFPPEWKIYVLDLRQSFRELHKFGENELPKPEQLNGLSDIIRSFYRDFRNHALHPQPPQLTNTDGEPLSFNKVIFDIENMMSVFDALHILDFNDSKEDLLKSAETNSSGELLRLEFPWLKKSGEQLKSTGSTVLGHITIEKNRMTVDTNSTVRAEAIKGIVTKLCGDLAQHKVTLIEPLEAKLAELRERGSNKNTQREEEDRDLQNHPAIKARLQQMKREQMESWISAQIPALGDQTPTQAIKTLDGREMVEALLSQFERAARRTDDPEFELSLIKEIRTKLGLSKA